jgi:hypothetical protein
MDWLKANNSPLPVVFLKRGPCLIFTQITSTFCFPRANSCHFPHAKFVQNQGMAAFPQAGRRPHVDFVALLGHFRLEAFFEWPAMPAPGSLSGFPPYWSR